VTKSGLPFTPEDYEKLETTFDELVLDQEAQVVPIFLLLIDPKSLRARANIVTHSDDESIF